MPREKTVETNLREKVKKAGGLCLKLAPFWFAGLPDRLILMPRRKVYFVETKAKGGRPSPIQKAIHKKLEKLGFNVYIVSNNEQVNTFINFIEMVNR